MNQLMLNKVRQLQIEEEQLIESLNAKKAQSQVVA
jgi:hypothetical protein